MTTKKSRIYTKMGDKGKTFLFGDKCISKDAQRVVAYGTLDEVNAYIGFSVSFTKNINIIKILQQIQNDLFDIGAELANPRKIIKNTNKLVAIDKAKVEELENIIDHYDSLLVHLENFILPGGTKAASTLHLARSTTRRAEREIVDLAKKEKINQNIISYLNRLSDLLFVLARYLNQKGKKKEAIWKK